MALVAMPFGGIHSPSLALSLLRAELARAGIPCDVHYLNLAFAERIGVERYDRYAVDLSGSFQGEWMFADCLFPRPAGHAERYVEEVLIPLQYFTLAELERCQEDRARAEPFLDDCVRRVDWSRYRVIGFTTTFQQNVASLALARRIREAAPDSVILFGGANCEGEMGAQLRSSFPWIDYVCTGEGDEVVPELVAQLLGRTPRAPLPGILGRESNGDAAPPRPTVNLDLLPLPDHADYFEQLDRTSIRAQVRSRLPVETSRGCWWGEKHHCTFCGLNGLTMRFRSKSPERALDEITGFVRRYRERLDPRHAISFTDNILDMRYFRTLLPALREAGIGLSLFYETKANLTKEQVRLLAESGVREFQPGIESLHSAILRLMRKGCTALQNVQLMKWCREYGITPRWNFLYGFPGEDPAWFEEQARTIRAIPHLPPPENVCPIRLDRFSPYYTDSAEHGITGVRPARAMGFIYDLPTDQLLRLAYHFDFDYADGRKPATYVGPAVDALREWMARAGEAFLFAVPWRERLFLWDGRPPGAETVRVLEGVEASLFQFCDHLRSRTEIVEHARAGGLEEPAAAALLADWRSAGLMLEDEGRSLALAVLLHPAASGGRSGGVTVEAADRTPAPAKRPGTARTSAPTAGMLAALPRRVPARCLEAGDELIVFDRSRRRVLVLDPIAAEILERCDGRRSVRAIAGEIAAAFPDAADQARADTVAAIESMLAENLVSLESC